MSDPVAPAAAPSAENRREPRFRVSARAQLWVPPGRRLDAKLCDISVNGLGLTAIDPVPMRVVLPVQILMADPVWTGQVVPIHCTVKIMNVVLSSGSYRIGAIWAELKGEALELVDLWIERQRAAGGAQQGTDSRQLQWTPRNAD